MSDRNEVVFEGNMVAAPELVTVSETAFVTKFTLAGHQHIPLDRDEDGNPTSWRELTSFVDIEAWNGLGESSMALVQGDKVIVKGQIKQERWKNDDGENRSKVIIKARKIS